jgi:hypothetical protein
MGDGGTVQEQSRDKRIPTETLERLMRAEARLAAGTQQIVVVREGFTPSDWDRRHELLNAMLDDWSTRER